MNENKPKSKAKPFKLIPDLPKAKEGESNSWLAWIKDWSDLLIIAPIMLVGFLTAKFWIVKVDPTAQVLDVANLVILNFNTLCFFFWSGVTFVAYKIYVGGNIFEDGWKVGLTPIQVILIKIGTLVAMGLFAAYFLSRNL